MAAKAKARLLNDESLGLLVDRKVRTAIGVDSSKIVKERERVLKYYNGELPRPQHVGQSSYVSTDVYDAVEAMKSDLTETFSGSQDIVKFSPSGPNDVEPCRIATEFCSYVFYRQNPGYHIVHDVIDDSLKARVGIVKVFWDTDQALEDEQFDGLAEDEVHGLSAQEDIQSLDADRQDDGSYSGTLTRETYNNSQVVIENVQPENFGVAPWAKRLKGYFHFQREFMTKSDMQGRGFDVSKLKGTQPANSEHETQETETQARFNQVDSGYQERDDEDQDEMRRWIVYECYDELILYKGDRPRLYKIVLCNKITLDVQEVARSPFKVYCALRTAHNFWGNSFANRVIPTQNARTVLTRGILDHTVITNNPRYTVLQGGLTNPREMLDNRLGGIVNTTRTDAVTPLQQASLNPFVFQTLSTLKENAEQTTGISSLSQGLNKDAISSQNSEGMVEGLVDLSKQRQKIMARNLAEFLAEVYMEIYDLVLDNQDRKCVMEVTGNWVEVDPSTWQRRKNYTIQFFLGQAAANNEAMNLTSLAVQAKSDPFLQRSMGDQGTYNLASDIARLRGVKGFSRYFQTPENTPPAQPTPEQQEAQLKVQELQLRQQEVQAKVQETNTKAQAEIQNNQHEAQMQAVEQRGAQTELALKVADSHRKDKQVASQINTNELSAQNATTELQLKIAESHRKDMQVANEIDVNQRELQIVEKAPPASLKAVAAPKG